MRVISSAFAVALLFAIASPADSQPAHHYVTVRNGTYGYTGDAPAQTKIKDLPLPVAIIFLKYLGANNGEFSFVWNNGAGNVILDKCKAPCTEYSETQFTGSHIDFTNSKKLDPTGGISQAFEDAMAGALERPVTQADSMLPAVGIGPLGETAAGDKQWISNIDNGPCSRLKDARTDAKSDEADCNALYANQPMCLVYMSFAKIWADMRKDHDPVLQYQPQMILDLGKGNDLTLANRSPQFRASLQRLLSATLSADQVQYPDGDKWADLAYSRCMSGQFL